jgi:hypothetical protein
MGIKNHQQTAHAPSTLKKIKLVEIGEKLSDKTKTFGSTYRRLDPTKPSPTVTRSGYRDFIHPYVDRMLTVRELACLQTFPLEWEFLGTRLDSYSSKRKTNMTQFGQVGNAVPPILAEAVGKSIMQEFFGEETVRNNYYISSSSDLITTREARRTGFLDYALRRNKESVPYIDQTKALKVRLEKDTKSSKDVLKLKELYDILVTASGVSEKAKAHLDDADKEGLIKHFIKDVLEPNGENYIDEIIYRYLLSLGDALGGKMRNIVGSIAGEKLSRFLIAQLTIQGIEFSFFTKKTNWLSGTDFELQYAEKIKAIRWKTEKSERSIVYNINVPQVRKNIDIVMLSKYIPGVTASALSGSLAVKDNYLAIGELKGGIDPAGADEHWKTANTALERVGNAFDNQLDLFFIGAAIAADMASEIFTQCSERKLSNAANLTNDEQLSSLCAWLISH